MSARGRWKLLAAVIIASALLGAVGWQQFAPKPTPPVTITITPTVTTVAGSQTTIVPVRQTEWIQVGHVKPVNHYLSLLESNGTSPYVQLAKELRKLPDLTNAIAVAKITYLALNATNPEVKEAFELMIKGGTPDPRDYQYQVPNYNTELQVLYWLACQNEFKKDDTLTLAIAMVNGLWVTMGQEQVGQAVKDDASELLSFLRETCEMQKARGFHSLEDYPLEVMITLVWTGNLSPIDGPIQLTRYRGRKLPLDLYKWMTPRTSTLMKMREIVTELGWNREASKTVAALEYYFYFDRGLTQSSHWIYTTGDSEIDVDGQLVSNGFIYNMNWMLRRYLETGKCIGQCSIEASWINTLLKSVGYSSNILMVQFRDTDQKFYGHTHIVYFDPTTRSWMAYEGQLRADVFPFRNIPSPLVNMYVFRPPVNQQGYLKQWDEGRLWNGNSVHMQETHLNEVVKKFTEGVPASTMKQWLLYS